MRSATRRGILSLAFKAMLFPKYRSDYFWGWRSAVLFDDNSGVRSVGDGSNNSIVSACVQWIMRNFPEAPPALWEEDERRIRTPIPRSDPRARILDVLRFPTRTPIMPRGYYSGVLLFQATLASRVIDGNAYWIKVRDPRPFRPGSPVRPIEGKGPVVQLWYVPHWMMEPRWPDDGKTFISHYEMNVNGEIVEFPPQDVVHFRHGIDPNNARKGFSPLHAVLREVYTDEEAARFSAAMLKNFGVPGLVVSPAAGNTWRGSETDVQAVKQRYRDDFTGDRRGEPLVFNSPTDVKPFGFTPQELDLSALRNVPEERVTAAVGLPAAVVGFGAGLQQTKVGATMAELRDQGWQQSLIPAQRDISEDIETQLMPDFGLDDDRHIFGFDNSRVKVLQDDLTKQAEAWSTLVRAGIAKRSEARSRFDLPSGPEDDTYLPQPGVGPSSGGSSNGDRGPTNQPNQLPEAQPA